MNKTLILFIIAIYLSLSAKAQYFQTGQDPSSVRWKQINTINFQVIYPEEFEIQAQRVSYILEKVYNHRSMSLNFNPRKVSVILHTRTVSSNGLVAWAPKRIELFTTPNQQNYGQDWLEQLGLHEFRHLVQMDKIQSELPGLVTAIMGQQAAAIVVGAFLPFWFLEGDAVVTETALSNSGRGRLASFSMDYRAQLIEKGKYSFDKAYLGSYKDYVTDYYRLGYWMVGKSREEFGVKIWSDAVKKVGRQPFILTPFNSSLKKSTGHSTKQMYSGIFDELLKNWKQNLLLMATDSITIVSPDRKNYTSYLYPKVYKDSILFAYRTSLDDIGRFVLIYPDKTEKILYTPGTILEESVSLTKNLIIWAENRADLRWSHADRSVIQVYDLEKKVRKEIRSINKIFAPVISPDLLTFAAVEVDPANNFFLSVFDLKSGKVIDRIKTTDNQYLFTPCWDDKGEKLFVVCLSAKGKYLASVDIRNKQFNQLTANTYAELKSVTYSKERVFFTSDFSGIDQLYSLDLKTHKINQIISVRFGANYPTALNSMNQMYFSNYTSNGFQLAKIKLQDSNKSKEINNIQLNQDSLSVKLAAQELGIPDFSNSDSVKYINEKYTKAGHLFNFHSWAPAFIDINSSEIKPGFSLFSQNVLGTAETRLGYEYNIADNTGIYKLGFNYSGFFPEINTELSAGNAASNYIQVNNTRNQFHEIIRRDTSIQHYTWKEIIGNIDIRLPLNLSKSNYSRVFNPEIKYTFNRIINGTSTPPSFYSGDYNALSYRIYCYNFLRQSTQNLMPKWGQQFDLIYRHTPFNGNDLGTLTGIQFALYFPGLTKNSGVKIDQGYQVKSFISRNSFSNFLRFPRGFQTYQNNKIYSLATDYKFPLFYPDFSFGKLAYIKRVKASVFYDFAWLSVPVEINGQIIPNDHELKMQSLGLELTADLHLLRFFAPLEFGCRSIYLPDFNTFKFDLLLSINFNGH